MLWQLWDIVGLRSLCYYDAMAAMAAPGHPASNSHVASRFAQPRASGMLRTQQCSLVPCLCWCKHKKIKTILLHFHGPTN